LIFGWWKAACRKALESPLSHMVSRGALRLGDGPGKDWPLAHPYNEKMARGWESKAVEAQQAEASEKSSSTRTRLTPEAAARKREVEGLRLSRQRIVQQLGASENARHRQLLEETLAELDRQLRALE